MMLKTFVWFFTAICAAGLIYLIKNETVEKERELKKLEREIVLKQEAIQVARAELAYLTSPKRLKTLAEKNLKLEPIKTYQIVQIDSLPMKNKPVAVDDAQTGGLVKASIGGR